MKIFERTVWAFTLLVLAFVAWSVVYFPFHREAEAALANFNFPEPIYPATIDERPIGTELLCEEGHAIACEMVDNHNDIIDMQK